MGAALFHNGVETKNAHQPANERLRDEKEEESNKGGNEEKFKKIMTAYEVLSDREKREIYDEQGEEGLSNDGMNVNPFESMFGGMHGFGNQRQRQHQKMKGQSVVFNLSVSLDDIYNGTLKKLRLNKNILCDSCNGGGMKDNKAKNKCSTCKGSGVQVTIRRIGPMIQQMQTQCNSCNGKGEIINEADKCIKCKGKCVNKTLKMLKIHIEKGVRNGEKIVFREESDQAPNIVPGDVIIIINEEKHKYYRRDGMDLWIKKTISLFESLTSYEFIVKHLDGRKLKLQSPREVTKPNSVKIIENEGMPEYKNIFNKGKLLVKFHVKFPDIMPEQYHQILMKIFHKKENEGKNQEDNKDNDTISDTLKLESFDYESYKTQKVNDDDDILSDNEYVEVNGCPTQ